MNRVLMIDDDVELCEMVVEYLAPEGFAIETVHDGEQGVKLALISDYAIIVLDVMLPGLGGFEVLRQLRQASRVPVLMLTARGDDIDRIVGLEMGADDYLAKPFNPRELVARIRAILRRAQPEASAKTTPTREILSEGDIELDVGARTVRRAGEAIELTAVEFNLLEIFLRSVGRVVSRDELVKEVLDREFSPYDRSIDMHVSNLRKKLSAQPNGSERIKSIRAVGYIYVNSP